MVVITPGWSHSATVDFACVPESVVIDYRKIGRMSIDDSDFVGFLSFLLLTAVCMFVAYDRRGE